MRVVASVVVGAASGVHAAVQYSAYTTAGVSWKAAKNTPAVFNPDSPVKAEVLQTAANAGKYLDYCRSMGVFAYGNVDGKFTYDRPMSLESSHINCDGTPDMAESTDYPVVGAPAKKVGWTFSAIVDPDVAVQGLFQDADIKNAMKAAHAKLSKENLKTRAVAIFKDAAFKELADSPVFLSTVADSGIRSGLFVWTGTLENTGSSTLFKTVASCRTKGVAETAAKAKIYRTVLSAAVTGAAQSDDTNTWACADLDGARDLTVICSISAKGSLGAGTAGAPMTPAAYYAHVKTLVDHATKTDVAINGGFVHANCEVPVTGATKKLTGGGPATAAATAMATHAPSVEGPTWAALSTVAGSPGKDVTRVAAKLYFGVKVTLTGTALGAGVCEEALINVAIQNALGKVRPWNILASASVFKKGVDATTGASLATDYLLEVTPRAGVTKLQLMKALDDVTDHELTVAIVQQLQWADLGGTTGIDAAIARVCATQALTLTKVTKTKASDVTAAVAVAAPSVNYDGKATFNAAGTLKIPVKDGALVKAFDDIDAMGKSGVAALLRKLLPNTADYAVTFETADIVMSKAKIQLSAVTTAKPTTRALGAKDTLITWPFSITLKAGPKLKLKGAKAADKDASLKKASTAMQAALKGAKSTQNKVVAEAMAMAGFKAMKALAADAQGARKTKFEAAFGTEGIDSTNASFAVTEGAQSSTKASTSFGFGKTASALAFFAFLIAQLA